MKQCQLTVPTLLAGAAVLLSGVAHAQSLPPQKRQATPEKVIAEHIAALNACDWNRMMAQYSDNVEFLSKDGNVVKGREAIGKMFKTALMPPAKGGQCGMKLIPEHTVVVDGTVNVVWRAEAPFFAEPYKGSEAFETKDGLLVLQVTTWDPAAIKMKK
ncbi:nuclear transport factor 2 family protein [Terriglobus roseus]|uniref:SnoaL-like domain-containing protein n=1 Tax=Terriglobus roseus TaxID=392734 RepID=A0A1H4NWZ4_9BACT|nr:nuclear transport factor 2 family protein [Terriglobus roseus]SEB99679.1 SnoaL-like domain-containing protein [Terriglobus roseus]